MKTYISRNRIQGLSMNLAVLGKGWKLCLIREELTPFNHVEGTFLAPGQTITSCLYSKEFKENGIREFTIKLKYNDGLNSYEQECPINYKAYIENVNVRAATKDKELRTISYVL